MKKIFKLIGHIPAFLIIMLLSTLFDNNMQWANFMKLIEILTALSFIVNAWDYIYIPFYEHRTNVKLAKRKRKKLLKEDEQPKEIKQTEKEE